MSTHPRKYTGRSQEKTTIHGIGSSRIVRKPTRRIRQAFRPSGFLATVKNRTPIHMFRAPQERACGLPAPRRSPAQTNGRPRLRMSRSILSRRLSRFRQSNSFRASAGSPLPRHASSWSALRTQFRIVCSEGANSLARDPGLRPALTSLTIRSLNSGEYRPTAEATVLLHGSPCSSSGGQPVSGSRGCPPPSARHGSAAVRRRRGCRSRWSGFGLAARRHAANGPKGVDSTSRNTRWSKDPAPCTLPPEGILPCGP